MTKQNPFRQGGRCSDFEEHTVVCDENQVIAQRRIKGFGAASLPALTVAASQTRHTPIHQHHRLSTTLITHSGIRWVIADFLS